MVETVNTYICICSLFFYSITVLKNFGTCLYFLEIVERWKQHFEELLNRLEPNEPLAEVEYLTAEEYVPEPSMEEVNQAVKSLKNNKAPGEDGINAELFKYGGEVLKTKLLHLLKLIWKQEKKPQDWGKWSDDTFA